MNKRDFEILRKAVAPKPIRLGQPPWSEEELTLAYFRNATQTKRKIESRPGAKYSHAIETLDLSVSLFKASVEALLSSIETFRQKSEEPNFGFRVCRSEEEYYQLAVRRNLFCASSAALALVEHSRKVQANLKILGYHERIDQDFKNHIDHLLIQGLRDCILHKRLLPANWQTTVILGEGKETRFFLCKPDLLSWKKWSSPVKKYLHNLDYGVDIEELFIAYRDRVVAFHSWYRDVIELAGDWALKEYQEYQRIIKGIGWRSSYLLLLKIARSAKIKPLERLNEFLFPNEIGYVLSTQDLKQQVDRIIEILDEYNACDDALRSEAYKLFGVNSDPK
jgi:hypothetical protein